MNPGVGVRTEGRFAADDPNLIFLYNQRQKKDRPKNFQCELCYKQFLSSVDLRRHSMTHTGEKPFACTLCSHKAVRKADIKRHMSAKHQQNVITEPGSL